MMTTARRCHHHRVASGSSQRRPTMTAAAKLQRAAEAILGARLLVVSAGAGMGVDSGLPDFRGPEGFWRAYPPFRKRNLTLPQVSNPAWFERDPHFAWGFFGHRLHLYRETAPHQGFGILLHWASFMDGNFVFTSNVDGHFQRAGFQDVVECHGSINFLQCMNPHCQRHRGAIWSADDLQVKVDEDFRALDPLPSGPPTDTQTACPARPNILMFGDCGWVSTRTDGQQERFDQFKHRLREAPFVVVEIGAGLAVPTVRYTSEWLVTSNRQNGTLIRINPLEPGCDSSVADRAIGLKMGGLEGLRQIDALMKEWRFSQ